MRIDDELVFIVTTAPRTIRQAVTGPTEIVVTVPQGIETRLVAAGANFGAGETIRFAYSRRSIERESGIDIKVDARVPAGEDLPIRLECAPRTRGNKSPAHAEGRTNAWVTLNTKIVPRQLLKKPRDKKSS